MREFANDCASACVDGLCEKWQPPMFVLTGAPPRTNSSYQSRLLVAFPEQRAFNALAALD